MKISIFRIFCDFLWISKFLWISSGFSRFFREKLENYESELRFVAHQKVPQIVADTREKFQIDAFKNGWADRPAIYIFVPMHFLVTALRAELK